MNTPNKLWQFILTFMEWLRFCLGRPIGVVLGLVGIGIGGWAYHAAHDGLFDWRTLAQDYGANVSTTLVSFTVAVLVIDFLNERREGQRWLPAKHLLYTQLLEAIDEFLGNVMPLECFSGFGIDSFLYDFGTSTTEWIRQLNDDWLAKLNSSVETLVDDDGSYEIEQIGELKHKIDAMLLNTQQLWEPGLTDLVLQLNKSLLAQPRYVAIVEDPTSLHKKRLGYYLQTIIIYTVQVMQWLESKADRHLTHEQFLEEFDKSLMS